MSNEVYKSANNAQLLSDLIKESIELSKTSALVKLASIHAKSKEAVVSKFETIKGVIEERIKPIVGVIQENSNMYDKIKKREEEINVLIENAINQIDLIYSKDLNSLILKRQELETIITNIAANTMLTRNDKQKKEEEREEEEKQLKEDINEKEKKAKELANLGDTEGARISLEECGVLRQALTDLQTQKLLDEASIGKRLSEYKERYKKAIKELEDVREKIGEIEEKKSKDIERLGDMKEQSLEKIDKGTAFRRFTMFVSKKITRTFNKGAAIKNEVIKPIIMKLKNVEYQIPVIDEQMGEKVGNKLDVAKEPFRNLVNKVSENGKSIRDGAIGKLQSANDKKREKIQNMVNNKEESEQEQEQE